MNSVITLSYGTILLNLHLAPTQWFRGCNLIFVTFVTNFNFFWKCQMAVSSKGGTDNHV